MELLFCLNMYLNIVLENENWIPDFKQYQFVSKTTIWPSQKMLCFVIFLKFRGVWFVILSNWWSISSTAAFQRKCVLLSLENTDKLYYEFFRQDAWANHHLTKWEDDLVCHYLTFRGVWFSFPLKLKEYKFNKPALQRKCAH